MDVNHVMYVANVNMKPKVFVTREIPQAGIKLLRRRCEVKVYPKDNVISRKNLLKGVKWCDVLLCLLTDHIDKKIINANPNLKLIANFAVGYNNIDIKYAKEKKIPVSNTPGLLTSEAVGEHTISLMFAITKRIVEGDRFMRKGLYKSWSPTLLMDLELAGKTIGIVGLGRIGEEVAKRAQAGMGMKVLYYDIARNKEFEKKYKAKFSPLKKLLKESDVVTLHVPLLKSTHHLIGKKELQMMKSTSFLINTSRGPVIDEKELVRALKKKEIAGAALDVYEFEPKLTSGLKKLDNVILTPHIASATREARDEMAVLAAKNILAVLDKKKIPNQVN